MELQNLSPISVDLPIVLPNGEETGITFKVVGEDSAAYRKGAKQVAQMFYAEGKPSPDALEALNNELMAGCIVGWTGIEEGGKPLKYSPAKALELVSKPELMFIREQVEACVSKRAQFFRKNT